MLAGRDDFELAGSDPFRVEAFANPVGASVLLLGSNDVAAGDLVIAGYDDALDGLEAGKLNGPNSPLTTCQPVADMDAAAITDYGLYGLYGVAQEAITAGQYGIVALENVTVPALVFNNNAALVVNQALMVDTANGRLVIADGTAKTIALLAAPMAASAATDLIVNVRLRGTTGF